MARREIRMPASIADCREVEQLGVAFGDSRATALGRLVLLWTWAKRDGRTVPGATLGDADERCGQNGFAAELVRIGWLQVVGRDLVMGGPMFPPPYRQQGREVSPAKPKRDRPRDQLFDAIVEVTGINAGAAGGFVAVAKKSLLAADPPYTPAEVREFGRRYAELCDWAKRSDTGMPTPTELAKYIGRLRVQPRPTKRTDGDRFLEAIGG